MTEEQNRKDWLTLAEQLTEAANGIIEHYKKKEFTEEGLYEMANGETVVVTRENAASYDFREITDNLIQRLWDKYGKRSLGKIDEHDLVRYLGKKKFEIDKPGVYENEFGDKIVFFGKPDKDGEILGLFIKKGISHYYKKDGSIEHSGKIVKFISPTWNFEKGEPV